MSLSLKVNGINYKSFTEARIARSIDVLTGAFSFISTADINNLFPIKQNDKVEILADDILVLTGYIESLAIRYRTREHNIEVSGRGLLADLIDSSVKSKKEFTGGISFENIARTILDDLGLTNISIINKAGTIENFSASEITSANVGQGAFEFLELFARKRQIFLNENGDGNLVLLRGGNDTAPSDLRNIIGANQNNIKEGSLTLDYTNRYNSYLIKSQLNPFFQGIETSPEVIADQKGQATDRFIRSTRFLELNSEESQGSASASERAEWEANIRRARSFNYQARLFGHSFNNQIWEPNTLVKVRDQFTDVDTQLLIRSVEYVYSIESGSETLLSCAPKDAYLLEAEQNQRDASTTENAEDFIND